VTDEGSSAESFDAEVPAMLDGVRLDRAVSFVTGLSRAVAAQLIDEGKVLVDGSAQTRRSAVLRSGSRLVVDHAGISRPPLEAEAGVDFEVVFSDLDVVVVDKPWDLVVHPGPVAGPARSSGGSWPGSPTSASWCRPGTANPIGPASCIGSTAGPRDCSSSPARRARSAPSVSRWPSTQRPDGTRRSCTGM
jgi:hypothetical protein